MITAAMFQVVEQAGDGVLVLVDGLSEADFLRSRLTRDEVRRQLLLMARTLASLPSSAQAALPELDWPGWQQLGRTLARPPTDAADWFAATAMVPALLSWLRVYRRSAPSLFAFRPAA